MVAHPPAPGPFVEPNIEAIEEAIRSVTFPISKRDMLDQISEEDTVVLNGRNKDLRTLVKDLPDDFFDDEDEFRRAVEQVYGATLIERPPELLVGDSPPSGFPDSPPPGRGGERDQPHLRDDNL